jgi:hypothetical protein
VITGSRPEEIYEYGEAPVTAHEVNEVLPAAVEPGSSLEKREAPVAAQKASKAPPVARNSEVTNVRKYEKMVAPVAAQKAGEVFPSSV